MYGATRRREDEETDGSRLPFGWFTAGIETRLFLQSWSSTREDGTHKHTARGWMVANDNDQGREERRCKSTKREIGGPTGAIGDRTPMSVRVLSSLRRHVLCTIARSYP